jgi:hypothetical protein
LPILCIIGWAELVKQEIREVVEPADPLELCAKQTGIDPCVELVVHHLGTGKLQHKSEVGALYYASNPRVLGQNLIKVSSPEMEMFLPIE